MERTRRSGNFTKLDQLLTQMFERSLNPVPVEPSSPELILSESDTELLREFKIRIQKTEGNFSTPLPSTSGRTALQELNISGVTPYADPFKAMSFNECAQNKLSRRGSTSLMSKSLIADCNANRSNKKSLNFSQVEVRENNSIEEFLDKNGIQGEMAEQLTDMLKNTTNNSNLPMQHIKELEDSIEKVIRKHSQKIVSAKLYKSILNLEMQKMAKKAKSKPKQITEVEESLQKMEQFSDQSVSNNSTDQNKSFKSLGAGRRISLNKSLVSQKQESSFHNSERGKLVDSNKKNQFEEEQCSDYKDKVEESISEIEFSNSLRKVDKEKAIPTGFKMKSPNAILKKKKKPLSKSLCFSKKRPKKAEKIPSDPIPNLEDNIATDLSNSASNILQSDSKTSSNASQPKPETTTTSLPNNPEPMDVEEKPVVEKSVQEDEDFSFGDKYIPGKPNETQPKELQYLEFNQFMMIKDVMYASPAFKDKSTDVRMLRFPCGKRLLESTAHKELLFFIVSGQAEVECDGETRAMSGMGWMFNIPKGKSFSISNVHANEELVLCNFIKQ